MDGKIMENIVAPLAHLQIQLEQKYLERSILDKYNMLLAGDAAYNLSNYASYFYVGYLWVGGNKK